MTINFRGVEFDVEYTIIEGEPEIRYDSNMTGTPATPDELIIDSIFHEEHEWTEILKNDEDFIAEMRNQLY